MALLVGAIALPLAAPASGKGNESQPPSLHEEESVRGGHSRLGWTWLAARCDKDANAAVTREELHAERQFFECLDRTWDGAVMADDFDWSDHGSLARRKEITFALFKAMDRNSNGSLSGEEWQSAFAAAAGGGPLHEAELSRLLHFPAAAKAERDRQSRAEGRLAAFEAEQPRGQTPDVGALAPDFELGTPDGARRIRLSSFRNKRPVVLIFGSFT
jgi:hypothetical protein